MNPASQGAATGGGAQQRSMQRPELQSQICSSLAYCPQDQNECCQKGLPPANTPTGSVLLFPLLSTPETLGSGWPGLSPRPPELCSALFLMPRRMTATQVTLKSKASRGVQGNTVILRPQPGRLSLDVAFSIPGTDVSSKRKRQSKRTRVRLAKFQAGKLQS